MMFSATDFLPDSIRTLTNLATSVLPNFGSGRISRLGTSRRRGISISFLSSVECLCDTRGGHHDLPLTRPRDRLNSIKLQELLLGGFSALRTVLRASLLTVFDALGIQRAANHVVTHTWQVFYTTAAQQHDAVFLQVVAFTADVRNDFETVGQANLGDFTQCRVRLLRSGGVHAGAHATLLRAVFKCRRFALHDQGGTWVANQLIDGWHRSKSNKITAVDIPGPATRRPGAKTSLMIIGLLHMLFHMLSHRRQQPPSEERLSNARTTGPSSAYTTRRLK